MTDSTGTVVWSADYLPFGQADVTVETVENNLRFAGQYYDQETGLHYNWHRYYDPTIGRYLRADPYNISTIASNLIINRYDTIKISSGDVRSFFTHQLFIESGLLTNPDRQNLFAYATNSPINYFDPYGLDKYGITPPETHPGGQEHIHWGNKDNPRQGGGAVNRDGSTRHGQDPPRKVKKKINKKYGWGLRGPLIIFIDFGSLCANAPNDPFCRDLCWVFGTCGCSDMI
jgi:RHS repeat-associated protein